MATEIRRPAGKSGKQAPNGFVRPKTAQQAVTDALRDEIITGVRAPGTQIVQEALAEQFQMSRIPIREALKTLEAEEHVVYEPHSGYRVTKLGLDELSEVFRLRDILEEELIRDALPLLTDDVVDRMRSAMAEMDDAAARGDLVTIGKANRRFHYLVFEASLMERTKRIVNQLWNTADAYRPLYAGLLDIAKVNAEHVFIVDAVADRDVEQVVKLNYEHRKHSIDHLRRVLGDAS
ncbi:GntR family transcriptional regulator [Rhodococcus fascians]|nr:GntR family transcriptional regulator [Rhodococcus fascians]MBY4237916.1 GntR family transcriptional regulator [Rhodococcus fascians]MBY4253333.1 GntR family transcriptional regulator [Rhodococcus fascians]MBY4268970.1 GntR family transcriptional regulator [Rhodococcus fascians]